ncbi:hypothetical protein ACTXT7_009290 [Hymenolepis weldensis]
MTNDFTISRFNRLNIPEAFLFLASEAVPSQTDNGDSSSSIITLEAEFYTEQSHTYDRARSKELSSIAGDSNSVKGEKQRRPPDQALAIRKTRDQKQHS